MAVEDVVSSELNTDIYVSVGFGLAFLGLVTQQIWWIFGGTLIFVSPFMGAFMDDELEKRKDKIHYVPVVERY